MMGSIRRHIREITDHERDALINHSEWYRVTADDLHDVQVAEFDIGIDAVVKYHHGDLRESQQLHVLSVGAVRIGFETCFMDSAIVSGSFPTDCVRVAFVVRPSAAREAEWDDATGAKWAIAFHWVGDPLEVGELPYDVDAVNEVLPIYRLWAMEQAAREHLST
jgi:hypothetical protein